MVEGESLNQLIENLQHLHLEQERIQERILQNLQDIAARVDADDKATNTNTNIVVFDDETTILPVAETVAVPVPIAVPVPPVSPVFRIGQRVYITNRINHVLLRRATEDDRIAIVTHFTASRVAIRTINAFRTHRDPKNLRPL